MIEQRKLLRVELNELLRDAPETETRNLMRFLEKNNLEAYDFFDTCGLDHFGLVADGRPIYIAVLIRNKDGENEFWTVVNSGVREIVSLCKYAKRELRRWVNKYGEIFATMEKVNPENIKWTQWLGFRVVNENDNLITFKIP